MDFPVIAWDFYKTSNYYEIKKNVQAGIVTVAYGITGCGKTQICAKLASEFKEDNKSRVYYINANTSDSLDNQIGNISTQLNLRSDIKKKELLLQLFEALNSSVAAEGRTVVIIDGVEVEWVLDDTLVSLDNAGLQWDLKNLSVIVASQIKPRRAFQERFCVIHVKEFSKEEAKDYLNIPKHILEEDLDISFLPASLHQLKEYLYRSFMKIDSAQIKRFVSEMEGKPEKYMALQLLKRSFERVLPTELQQILKHLSVFSRNRITITEQLIDALGIDNPDSFVNAVVRHSYGSIQTQDSSAAGRKCLILHPLVTKATNLLIQPAESLEIFRNSLLAFSRIMPRNCRHLRSDQFPNILDNALSLRNDYVKITKLHEVDQLTKLLYAELNITTCYWMMSLQSNASDVISQLEEAKKLFLELLFQGQHFSEDFERDIHKGLVNKGTFMLSDTSYIDLCTDGAYINKLQLMQRLSQEEFEALFQGQRKLFLYKECDHLSHKGFEKLRRKNFLLNVETLAHIYPLELFAQLLHLFSKSYSKMKDYVKATEISEKADSIYRSIREHCSVTLLGMYINRRFLYNMRAKVEEPTGLVKLLEDWEKLSKEDSGMVYENGIVKSIDMSKDAYHQLVCYEGELAVCGSIASYPHSDPITKTSYADKGEYLVKEIETHCIRSSSPFIASMELSRSYIKISKFYQLCSDFRKAISYSVKSMIAYHKYWLEKSKAMHAYPELDEDKINKFLDCYKQLETCLTSLKGDRQAEKGSIFLKNDEKEYLEHLYISTLCESTAETGAKQFNAINEILQMSNREH